MFSRRLSILLVASEMLNRGEVTTIGLSESFLDDSGFVDYIELLSAANFSFDIITPEKISFETFYADNIVRYSLVIITIPLVCLSDSAISILKEASYKLGISLISSYTSIDERSKAFFGIQNVRGKRLLIPLKVKIIRWPRELNKGEIVVSYGLFSGLPGIRKRGFGRLDLKRTLFKLIKLFNNLKLPYVKVNLEPGAQILATDMKGHPIVWSYHFGEAINYYFALHGDLFISKFNEMHRLVRAVIEANSGHGMVSVDLENTMVLRLDDPGACSADYLKNGKILEEKNWEEIGRILEDKKIPLSVMYTPGWVDDGDSESGTVFLDNEKISERKTGAIYDSDRVKYVPAMRNKNAYDHKSEFRGLKKLVEKGFADVHSHGLTHLDPDRGSWCKAKDKNKDPRWYYEFYHVKSGREVNKDEQIRAMMISREKIKKLFGEAPCVLTPSGHRTGSDSDLLAYACGYLLFSADFTGILKENMVIRNWNIPSLFLCLKDPSSIASRSGYPFIGVIHDYEIKQQGFDSLHNIIKGWQSKGIKRFISLQELAANLCFSVVGYWFEKERKFRIIISPPITSGIEDIFSQSRKIKIRLRVIPPLEEKTLTENLSIVGSSLTLVQPGDECFATNDIPLHSEAPLESSSLKICLSVSSPRIRR